MFTTFRSNSSCDPKALIRINLTYLWRHGRLPNLSDPRLFTELVQLRKLCDRNPLMPLLADKVAVKAFVADRLGRDWIIPTLWSGARLPGWSRWRDPVVVKSRHGCNQNAFVYDHDANWQSARARSARWMTKAYGEWLDEWAYGLIPRGLLVEPHISSGGELPLDYKFYVFGGVVTHIQVHLDRAHNHRWIVHDRDWRPISKQAPTIPRPSKLSEMIAAAEEIGRGFGFARIDFYQPAEQPLFGEISFYPGSGLDPFDPPALDAEMGRLWLRAGGDAFVSRQSGMKTGRQSFA